MQHISVLQPAPSTPTDAGGEQTSLLVCRGQERFRGARRRTTPYSTHGLVGQVCRRNPDCRPRKAGGYDKTAPKRGVCGDTSRKSEVLWPNSALFAVRPHPTVRARPRDDVCVEFFTFRRRFLHNCSNYSRLTSKPAATRSIVCALASLNRRSARHTAALPLRSGPPITLVCSTEGVGWGFASTHKRLSRGHASSLAVPRRLKLVDERSEEHISQSVSRRSVRSADMRLRRTPGGAKMSEAHAPTRVVRRGNTPIPRPTKREDNQ